MYAAATEKNEYLLEFVDIDPLSMPTEIEFSDMVLSPLQAGVVILHGPDGYLQADYAVYGRLPNGVIFVAVMAEPYDADLYDLGFNIQVVLDPFTEYDDPIVDLATFTLLEDC